MLEKPCGPFQFAILRAIENSTPERVDIAKISSFVRKVTPAVATSQFYVTLNRLRERGLVSVTPREKRPIRGGRRGNLYGLTDAGKKMVGAMRAYLSIMLEDQSET